MLLDKRIRVALGLALAEWVLVGMMLMIGGEDRFPFVVVVIGVASAMQFWALFGQWGRRPPIADAQQYFATGAYQEAATLLETLNQHDVQVQTLLGNTYRQLGQLEKSEAILRSAVTAQPRNAFPLYGLGRTLLAKGDFAAAADRIEQALQRRGRRVIAVEAALAHYLAGDEAAAVDHARRASRLLNLETYRVLMVNYLLLKLADDDRALAMMRRNENGLRFWQAETERFASTPFGQRLAAEVEQMQVLLEAEKKQAV